MSTINYTKQETDIKIYNATEANRISIENLELGETAKYFKTRADATAYWEEQNSAGNTPTETFKFQVGDTEYHVFDAIVNPERTTKVGDVIQVAENIDDSPEKVAKVGDVKIIRDDVSLLKAGLEFINPETLATNNNSRLGVDGDPDGSSGFVTYIYEVVENDIFKILTALPATGGSNPSKIAYGFYNSATLNSSTFVGTTSPDSTDAFTVDAEITIPANVTHLAVVEATSLDSFLVKILKERPTTELTSVVIPNNEAKGLNSKAVEVYWGANTTDDVNDSNQEKAAKIKTVKAVDNKIDATRNLVKTEGIETTYTNGQVIAEIISTGDATVEPGSYTITGVKTTTGLNAYRFIEPISIVGGKLYRYQGDLYTSDNVAIVIRDSEGVVLDYYNESKLPSGETNDKDFEFTTPVLAADILLCYVRSGAVTEMTLTFTDATFTEIIGGEYKLAKSASNGENSVEVDSEGNLDLSALIPESPETPSGNSVMFKYSELTNYALYPDNPLDIFDAIGASVSNIPNVTALFDILTHTTTNSDLLGKGWVFNITNASNTTLFTFTWATKNYMSFVIHKATIESGDSLGFSNSSGGFNWLNLSTGQVTGNAGFEISIIEQVDNYIKIQCYHATNDRKKVWLDVDTTSDVTLYDIIVSPSAINKYATYRSIYRKNQSQFFGKRCMIWGDSNLSTGIVYSLREQLGVGVSVNGAGGRRMGINDGVQFSQITTANYETQTGDGNWLGSWFRKKAIKYAIDNYGSVDLMCFFTCYNDSAGDAYINSSGTFYGYDGDIPDGTEGDFTNYSVLADAEIAAVEYNYPQLTDDDATKDIKYARWLALTNTERKQIFGYRQTFAALIKEVLAYNPNCIINLSTLLYLPASDDGGTTASTDPATWRSRKDKFDKLNQAIRDIADWFGVSLADNNKQTGYYIGNAYLNTPDGTHFNANIGYRIGFNTARHLLNQSDQLNYSGGTGSGPIVP